MCPASLIILTFGHTSVKAMHFSSYIEFFCANNKYRYHLHLLSGIQKALLLLNDTLLSKSYSNCFSHLGFITACPQLQDLYVGQLMNEILRF